MLGNRCLVLKTRSAQSRAECALVIVSSVVKILEEMMNRCLGGIQINHRLGEICSVDVEEKAKTIDRSL